MWTELFLLTLAVAVVTALCAREIGKPR